MPAAAPTDRSLAAGSDATVADRALPSPRACARRSVLPVCSTTRGRTARAAVGVLAGRAALLARPDLPGPWHRAVRKPAASLAGRFQDMDVVAPADADSRRSPPPRRAGRSRRCRTMSRPGSTAERGPHGSTARTSSRRRRPARRWARRCCSASTRASGRSPRTSWTRPARAGFPFAAGGEEGAREALSELCRRFGDSGAKGGRQAALGLIYHWLQFHRSGRAKGPVEDVVREFILDTMAVDPGTVLFGRTVPTRRRHSVASLARQMKMHPEDAQPRPRHRRRPARRGSGPRGRVPFFRRGGRRGARRAGPRIGAGRSCTGADGLHPETGGVAGAERVARRDFDRARDDASHAGRRGSGLVHGLVLGRLPRFRGAAPA